MIRVGLVVMAIVGSSSVARGGDDVIRLYVWPMQAPTPALKYQLLPDADELSAGNPAQAYLKCFMEQTIFFYGKESVAERTRYQTLPLAELPAGKLRGYGGNALRQADWAARLNALDWQADQRIEAGVVDLVPPELGQFQLLAQALRVRFRGEVAERRFPEAVRSAQTMFAFARHLGAHPSEVGGRVGLAVAHLSFVTLRELVQQPGCPNLYWALTDLPCPLVDLKSGMHARRAAVSSLLRRLRSDAVMTDAEIDSWLGEVSGQINYVRELAGRSPRNLRAQLTALADDTERVSAARRRLIEAGLPAATLKTFSPVHVVLLDEKREFEIQQDDRITLLAFPVWQRDPAGVDNDAPVDGLFADLLPRVSRLRQAQAALEQELALLRQVEALRLHAAGHDGRLPARLSDIDVPLPSDPVNGKPFVYEVSGKTAHLHASPIPGVRRDQRGAVDLEIVLLK